MFQKIQVRRGLRSELPILSAGEIGFCTDTKEIFIGDGVANIAFANKAPKTIIVPTLLNGWVSRLSPYAPVDYYKDEFGIVHFEGGLMNGTAVGLFNAMVGYRPLHILQFSSQIIAADGSTPSLTLIQIDQSGNVITTNASGKYLFLQGITYRAEQ